MRTLILGLLMLVANAASADRLFDRLDKFYLGGGLNHIDAHAPAADGDDATFTAAEVIFGYKYNSFVGLEFRGGIGLGDESISATIGDVTTTLDSYTSVYWRTESANETAKIYLLFGATSVTIGQELQTLTGEIDESGFSYGGGIGFVFWEDWNLNFEIREIIDTGGVHLSNFGINVDYRF